MKTEYASFNRFELPFPEKAIEACSHSGACDDDVSYWAKQINRPEEITPEALRAELRECGCWDSAELADDSANWERLVWIAAGNIKDNRREDERHITHFSKA